MPLGFTQPARLFGIECSPLLRDPPQLAIDLAMRLALRITVPLGLRIAVRLAMRLAFRLDGDLPGGVRTAAPIAALIEPYPVSLVDMPLKIDLAMVVLLVRPRGRDSCSLTSNHGCLSSRSRCEYALHFYHDGFRVPDWRPAARIAISRREMTLDAIAALTHAASAAGD